MAALPRGPVETPRGVSRGARLRQHGCPSTVQCSDDLLEKFQVDSSTANQHQGTLRLEAIPLDQPLENGLGPQEAYLGKYQSEGRS